MVRRLRVADQIQDRKIAATSSLTLNSYCPFQRRIGRVCSIEVRPLCDMGVSSGDRFAAGEGDDCLPIKAFRDVLLDEDLDFGCSGLVGSRSFILLMVCRRWITDFDGLLSLALAQQCALGYGTRIAG
ncbi:hypothetical protein AK812_SmicGene23342 [Symbiodinium microadriaticum]|uniref:Uncharacterized protein n=1 Tax=Symbiodinium microadriaticum TaxID=2951 RepID=A0A1Q9DHH2_SYMMI|nr:hypothetical protein AK812_SmicGene23342 [Symbiodinium microadriaticum]